MAGTIDGQGLQTCGAVATKTGRAGLLQLDCARLTSAAWRQLSAGLQSFARDPDVYCTILELLSGSQKDLVEISPNELAAAYAGLWSIDRFNKPQVALIEGKAEWGAMALAVNGTHRVADPAATFAIADVAGGIVPGWGASFWLPALPGRLGLYMALTGGSIDAALAYRHGWLTHRIESAQFAEIGERLAQAEPVDALLDGLDLGPASSSLDARLAAIEHCFSAPDPSEIVARLDALWGADADWAKTAANAMRAAPLPALAVTRQLLTAHAQPTLRDGLVMDFRVASNWREYGPAELAKLFAPPDGGDLPLPAQLPPSIS